MLRINMAHGTRADHEAAVAAVREASRIAGQPLAILVDLAGPKIRLAELPGGELTCAIGSVLKFVRGENSTATELATTYEPLVDELEVGKRVILADGAVSLEVIEKSPDSARARVVQGGIIRSRQGLNLPGMKLSAPALGPEDRDDARWAAGAGVDYLGLSFVRAAADVRQLAELIRQEKGHCRVIAKIEKQEALDDLEAIVDAADGAMVARGDLGVEIDVARMPIVQKHIVAVCQRRNKPVIIATQMLESMHNSPRPTRAEVTDVANAILEGADACMLSGETAVGKYPREAVAMMHEISVATEELYRCRPPEDGERNDAVNPVTAAVTHGATQIARSLDARLIVVASHSGAAALALAKKRSFVPIVGVSDVEQTLRHMALYWGVIPLAGAPVLQADKLIEHVRSWALRTGMVAVGDYLVLVAGTGMRSTSHNAVVVQQVE